MNSAIPHAIKRDEIVVNLRRKILTGALQRGTRVRQDEVAQEFEASITPVREAFSLLVAEGLLVSEPHRGVKVAKVDLDAVSGIYIVRRLVESYAMRRAAYRLSRRDLDLAREILNELEIVGASGDVDEYRARNRQFHFFFYERCGLPSLFRQIEGIWQAFPWDMSLVTPDRARESNREHLAILDALQSADADGVALATEIHIANGFQGIARQLLDNDRELRDPFDIDVD